MKWNRDNLQVTIKRITEKYLDERVTTHRPEMLIKAIEINTGIKLDLDNSLTMYNPNQHLISIKSDKLDAANGNIILQMHLKGSSDPKKYMVITPHLTNLLKLHEKQLEEEKKMAEEYKPLLDILKYMKSGDVLERKSDGQGIVLDGAVFSWYNIEEDKRTGTIALTTALLDTKFRVLPHYVGWQEAFEAYENGYTIGCEYGKETVWFNRDITTLDESNILADKQLDGLITTKWILK